MQTFLPFADFTASARVLDRQRLGKQRVETLQLLKAITDPEARGWVNHPCAKQWRGHVDALVAYGVAVCDEWVARGYNDTCKAKILAYTTGNYTIPQWLGDGDLHASHRGVLLHKNPLHYGQYGWSDRAVESVIWPV